MHTNWLRRALAKGLKQTALAGLVHCVLNPDAAAERTPSRSRSRGSGSLMSKLRGQSPSLSSAKPPLGERSLASLPKSHRRLPPRATSGDKASADSSPRGRNTPPLPPLEISRPASAARHKPMGLVPRSIAPRQAQVSAVDWG
ncbi:unnamed protein product [Effrenium voratum]|uniref:Uncharacterized protein n=1 Tax=Effrenium voratum TaxID=2562239 RepID=A0AA36ITI6_9DINO|nr:unnamed protein product [Effrenium voratum]CAJ1420053.1 unnamed protein product [Effrenium voratum]